METSPSIPIPTAATPRPLHLTVDPIWDWFCALEFGLVFDGWPHDRQLQCDDCDVTYLLADDGTVLGFELHGWNDFEILVDDPELWDGPRFDVPRLGLVQASAGEILTAARAQFGSGLSIDAALFHAAINKDDLEERVDLFEAALDAGDMKAHYALGYTLLDLGRPREAYAHLRRYTEIAPANAWAWCYLGQACVALAERLTAMGVRPHEVRPGETVVVGVLEDDVIVLPEREAERLAALHDVLARGGTLREVLAAVSPAERTALEEGLEEAALDEPFPSGDFGPLHDGDWPTWPPTAMLDWLPPSVLALGRALPTVLNDDVLELPAVQLPDVELALHDEGLRVRHDDDLVARACGGWRSA